MKLKEEKKQNKTKKKPWLLYFTAQQEKHREILFSIHSRNNIFLYFITPLSEHQDKHFVGSMHCYHLGLRLAQNVSVLEMLCRKVNIYTDIGSDSYLPGTNGTLFIYLSGFWIKTSGTNLSQCFCKFPFKGLWTFIDKNYLENWNIAS